MRVRTAYLGFVLVVGLMVTPAVAEDLNPPYWRGLEGTTFARWEFGNDDPYPPPDDYYNPYGMPEMEVEPLVDWYQTYDGREGVWALSGEIWIDIWNQSVPLPYKWIWVQITWTPMEFEPNPFPIVEEIYTTGGPYYGTLEDERVIGPDPYEWYHSSYWIELSPNPNFETIYIGGDIYVDEVVIDTWCFPEPASLSLLALGSLFVLRRKR